MMRIIGTAGHVDHGKSTLVETLTGTHPDRLKEEREREMTIDLGFAWFTLANGEEVGIIDVPGHRDFIENMLAGIAGIDAALFVIAADEGIMPQTREHIAILDLLQIQSGVVVLTKVDLIDDPEWLDLIEEDVRQALKGTVLANAPIVRISARTRMGITELLEAIADCLAITPIRPNIGKPRLPIDRIFSIAGFGSVVTGTLSDGILHLGDELEILPTGIKSRIRGLQTHKRKAEFAIPGSRTAVNLGGVSLDDIRRGQVVTHPGDYTPTRRLDVRYKHLPDAKSPLHHNCEVKFFVGASEVLGRVRLLGLDELLPGQTGWLQLELIEPVVAVRNDHFILRRPSPGETIGGGTIVDPFPKRRHKRFATDVLNRLETIARGAPADVLLQVIFTAGIITAKQALLNSGMSMEEGRQAMSELIDSGQVIPLEAEIKDIPTLLARDSLVCSRVFLEQIKNQIILEIDRYHAFYPLRRGMSREELKSKIGLQTRVYQALLRWIVSSGELIEIGALIARAGFAVRFDTEQLKLIERVLNQFYASPAAPPSVKEVQAELGGELLMAVLDQGLLVQVTTDVIFSKTGYDQMVSDVIKLLQKSETISAGQVRDHFNTSRRYVLALLEHMDQVGITVRLGDVRRLRK